MWHVQRRDEGASQIWLVEAGEGRVGLVRHKYRVQIVLVAVQGLVLTGKVDFHHIGALLHKLLWQHNMLFLESHRALLLVVDGASAVESPLEVEHDFTLLLQVKGDDGLACHGCLHICGDVECQVITDVADVGFTLVGKCFRNAFGQLLRIHTQHHQAEHEREH